MSEPLELPAETNLENALRKICEDIHELHARYVLGGVQDSYQVLQNGRYEATSGIIDIKIPSQQLQELAVHLYRLNQCALPLRHGLEFKQCLDSEGKETVASPSGHGRGATTTVVAILIPLFLTLPFYVCTTYNEWYIDEMFAIVRNPDVQHKTPLRNLFINDFWGQYLWPTGGNWTHKSFRPLTTLSFRLQLAFQQQGSSAAFAMRPEPLRMMNCFLHSCNVIFLALLLHALKLNWLWVGVGAALFALHPVHLENLPYLVGRADSLATLFLLLGLLLRLLAPRLVRRPLRLLCKASAVACAPIAGLCKETGLTLPAIFAWQRLAQGCAISAGMDLLWFCILCVARSCYVGGTSVGFAFVDTPIRYSGSVVTRTLSYMHQHAYYGQLLVLPWNQSWDYSYDALPLVRTLTDVRVLAILAAYGSLLAVTAWACRIRSACGVLAIGLIVLPFVPCSNLFFLVGTTIAERLLYPSSAGWSLLVAAFGQWLVAGDCTFCCTSRLRLDHGRLRTSRRRAWLVLPMCSMLMALYAFRAGLRTWQWRTRVSLFIADMWTWKRSAKVTHQYASLLHGGGRLHEALAYYSASLDVFDDNALTDYCIAQVQMQLERYSEAGARFEKILAGHGIGFGYHNAYLLFVDYGWVLTRLGQYVDGEQRLAKGVQMRPDAAYAWNALGVAQARLQKLQDAMASFLKAVELLPRSPTPWSNAAVVATAGGAHEQAQAAMQNALALAPQKPTSVWNARVILDGGSGQPSFELFLDTVA